MSIGYVLRHPVLAFNRRWVCSYWGHDPRGGFSHDSHGEVIVLPETRCTRCQEIA